MTTCRAGTSGSASRGCTTSSPPTVEPRSRLVCVAPNVDRDLFERLTPLLATELNVKRVEIASSADALVTLEAKPNFKSLGKRFGKRTPLAAKAVATLTGDQLRAFERG